MTRISPVRWIPSRVEGAQHVIGATVYPDRIELSTTSGLIVRRFADIARWPSPRFAWRALAAIGLRPRWLPVGERDWFHPPQSRFFRFYTDPTVTVYCEDEPENLSYGDTLFRQIQEVMLSRGSHTVDLG